MEPLNLKQLSDERSAFQTSGNIEAIGCLMHHTFRYVDSSGRQFDKETFLDRFVDSKAIQWIAQETITFDELIKGDLAVIQILFEERFIIETNAYEGRFWALHLYVKENDTWFWQGGQATLINE